MPESRLPSTDPTMLEPPCAICGEPMKLTRLEPAKPGHDLRVFECKCGHSETREVAYK
jgi:hypothetical protein